MKKLYKFIILGALAVSVASCEKEISPIENGPDQGKQIRTEVIGVKTESEATKVTLSGTTFGWVDGDEIAVWSGTNAVSGSFQDCEVSGGKISVTLGEGQARYNYAIYPAAVKDASNYGQGTLTVILPSSYTLAQVSGENTPLPMVAVNDKESSNLTFYNVAGLLRVTVKAIPSDATGLLFQFPGKIHFDDLSSVIIPYPYFRMSQAAVPSAQLYCFIYSPRNALTAWISPFRKR